MDMPIRALGPRLQLEAGLDLLEEWAESAGQARKNVAYKALLGVTDGSVFRDYLVLDDANDSGEFTIMLKEDLLIRIALRGLGGFGISYIGSAGTLADAA